MNKMKKLLLLAVVMTLSMTMSLARDQKAAGIKTTTFVADIHCENCSIKVMNNVPALGKGIKDVAVDVAQKTDIFHKINLAQKTITVTYDAGKNSDDRIVKGLKSLNVTAQPQPTESCQSDKPCCNAPGGCKSQSDQPAATPSCCKTE